MVALPKKASRALFVVGLAVLATVATSPASFAAGSGYSPGEPAPGATAAGLPGTVVSSTTIPPAGGSVSGAVGGSTVTTTIPAGTFTGPTQAVLTDATGLGIVPPGGGTSVATFGVGFYVNGTKVTGTFPAVTITVASSSIKAGSTVYLVVGTSLQAVSGANVTNGSATFSITSDPIVEIATTSTSSLPITGATSVQTGKPFLLEGGIAATLVLVGGLLLIRARVRRNAS